MEPVLPVAAMLANATVLLWKALKEQTSRYLDWRKQLLGTR
jgi:hypothetical protein